MTARDQYDYPYEVTEGRESFKFGYRNYAGGGQSWPPISSLEAAQALLAVEQQRLADLPADTNRASIPVRWYIERVTYLRRIELVSEVEAS